MISVVTGKNKDSHTSSIKRIIQPWVVCFSAALFFFFIFIQLNMPNSIGIYLTQSLHIDATTLASIADKYFLANVIFLFPAGMLLDKFSTRKLILMAMSIAVICTYLFAFEKTVWQMQWTRFVIGLAGSFCLLSSVRLASRWFPPRKMALVVGLIITFAMLGGMVAQTPLLLLTESFGWRFALLLDATFGVLLLFLIYLFVRDNPEGASGASGHVNLTGRAFWQALKATVSKRQNWFAGLYTSLMNLPVFIFGAMWGVFYLTQNWHLSKNTSTILTSLLFIGMIIGSPLVGWFSDKIQRRKLPMILGAILSLLFILVLMFNRHLSVMGLGGLFLAIGFISSAQIISYPLIAESNPLSMTATAEGFASVLIMGGGYVQTLFAYLIQLRWAHQFVGGQPFYAYHDYLTGLAILPLGFVISLILTFFVKETYCQPFQGNDDGTKHSSRHE